MKITSDTGPDRKNIDTNCKKLPWQAPVLRVYGAVSQWTAGSGGNVGDAGSQTMRASDRALKQNIVQIDNHPAGFGLYLFDYKPEFAPMAAIGRQFGVMADEVEAFVPQAVVMHPDGYKRVDYAQLGIRFPN